jgi:O-antigen ligase/polysaccharide polymerase Wzy-like membrane protein
VKIREEQPAKSTGAKVLDAAILAFLFLFVASAPNSIAATQTSWLLGMLFWLLRFAFRPRPRLYKTPVDYFLLGFFILSGLSAFLSYEPMVSVGKLRAASLFTIIYLFAENIPSLRVVRLLAVTLIGACMINVVYTAGERLLGQGVKVYGVSGSSALYQANVRDGDTLLTVDGKKLRDPQELVNALSRPDSSPASILVYRHELQFAVNVPRGSLLPGRTALEQLGVEDWSRGRDWRASGFYSQYVSYAEVLQLIIALALGLFINLPNKRSVGAVLLLIALTGFSFALLLTITRASWFGAAVSALIILLLSVQRRTVLIIGVLAIPLLLAGLFVLQQKRNVGFLDQKDGSTTWRETVWREGVHLLVSNPRHLLIGIGMDTIKKRWRQWGLFDGGRLPWGHMHSNPLQIALERGLPALGLWLAFLFVYARTLWRLLRSDLKLHWIERGILLGALGGLAGFSTSGLVHYNWGDSEVVMVLYLIMGLSLAMHRLVRAGP